MRRTEPIGIIAVGLQLQQRPPMLLEDIQRGIVHSCQHRRFHGLVLAVADGQAPGFFGSGTELVAHRGQFHLQIEIIVRHLDAISFDAVAVLLVGTRHQAQRAPVAFGDNVGQGHQAFVHLHPLIHAGLLVVVDEFQPIHRLFGRTPKGDVNRVARLGFLFVDLQPKQLVYGHLPRHSVRHDELLRQHGQSVVETLQLQEVSPRLKLAVVVETPFTVHLIFRLADQSLLLVGIETVVGEKSRQLFVAQ